MKCTYHYDCHKRLIFDGDKVRVAFRPMRFSKEVLEKKVGTVYWDDAQSRWMIAFDDKPRALNRFPSCDIELVK